MSSTNTHLNTIQIQTGTTFSCVGVWQNDGVQIIANDMGNRTTPSMVSFQAVQDSTSTNNANNFERLIGDGARQMANSNPQNTIFDAKRLIGRKYSDVSVQNDRKHWPFLVKAGKKDKPEIVITSNNDDGNNNNNDNDIIRKSFSAEEISSMVLSKMKTTAEEYLGK